MYSIKIEQWPEIISSGRGSLLDRALRERVPYPHQCRTGECGRCKSRLLSGKVKQLPASSTALSTDDQQQNLILACRSMPLTDVEVAWLENTEAGGIQIRQLEVEVCQIQPRGRAIVLSLRQCDSNDRFAFESGQYVQFSIPDLPERPYSMASVMGDELLEFHIERKSSGWVSSYIASKLRIGDKLTIEGPFGDAYFRPEESGPVVGVAAGTGLAPVLSIVKSALLHDQHRPVALVYSEKYLHHQYLADELILLAQLHPALQVNLVTSEEKRDSTVHNHAITTSLQTLSFPIDSASVYIAGSPRMVQFVANTVNTLGADQDRVRADAFTETPAPVIEEPTLAARLGRLLTGSLRR